jgi:hypothetical protein
MDPVKFSELYNSFVAIEKNIHKGVNEVFTKEKDKWQSLMQVYGSDLVNPPTDPQQKQITCKYCSKLYNSSGGLYYHVQSVHLGIKYTCHLCFRQYRSKSQLKQHMKNTYGPPVENTKAV